MLVIILLLAAFLRLYKISDYMTFLGDEGRDVLIVKHLLEGDLIGLGPTASVGGFFTGPIYYYFMAPFLWLFKLNPVGPAVMVALFGIATVYLVYLLGKEFFNIRVGLFAASLYAVSPIIIAFSRSSWNPNPLPFFSALSIFCIYKFSQKKSIRYLLLSGILLGIALQLHYIAGFLITAIVVYLLITGFSQLKTLLKQYFNLLLGFIIGYSPFLAFEATHGFPNTVTVIKFILGGTNETGFTGGRFNAIIGDVFFRLTGRLISRFPPPEQINIGKDAISITLYGPTINLPLSFIYIFTLSIGLIGIFLLIKQATKSYSRDKAKFNKYLLLLVWFFVGIFLFGFYKKPIYDYYLAFMFPLPFLLVGNALDTLYTSRFKKLGKILAFAIFLFLFLLNFDGMPFRYSPNRQLAQVKRISEFVLEKAEGRPFNFALITTGNSDHGYRYFFEIFKNPPVKIENEAKDSRRKTITEQLLIVCEDPRCQPLGNSLWEVAGFGRAEIAGAWNISVVKIYKLAHLKEN